MSRPSVLVGSGGGLGVEQGSRHLWNHGHRVGRFVDDRTSVKTPHWTTGVTVRRHTTPSTTTSSCPVVINSGMGRQGRQGRRSIPRGGISGGPSRPSYDPTSPTVPLRSTTPSVTSTQIPSPVRKQTPSDKSLSHVALISEPQALPFSRTT